MFRFIQINRNLRSFNMTVALENWYRNCWVAILAGSLSLTFGMCAHIVVTGAGLDKPMAGLHDLVLALD